VDALAVQGQEAGGHYGTFTPDVLPEPTPLAELLGRVGAAVRMPLLAAGGVGSAADVKSLLGAGAAGVAVGTALLLTDESGASATYKTALRSGGDRETVVTRAFSGRPARALRGSFTDRFTAVAPSGYPAIHHLTSPLRRAAAAAGDGERINVWAGTGHAQALAYEGSATAVLTSLASEA
ncbi:MAG TPA: nitronate monooxygenase, partial [Acidimicrobiales bacterium]|nr:nitronate monooxygenase [Acidimicrobiales bacterium]